MPLGLTLLVVTTILVLWRRATMLDRMRLSDKTAVLLWWQYL